MDNSVEAAASARTTPVAPADARLAIRTLLAVPVAIGVAWIVHLWASQDDITRNPYYYSVFLGRVLGAAIVASVAQLFWPWLRRWMRQVCAIIAGLLILLALWETITAGLGWLPLPYFPGPAAVLGSLIEESAMLLECVLHSLMLLVSGYFLGVVFGLVTGVCIGWFSPAQYWGMPLLKIVGPIPATAWIPLAMVIAPTAIFSAVIVIAVAVWFPVTMLTISGIANTRASYLDVARTLGASESYLIFRVAIPAAMPNIFIGLFMGLGASFLTLIVAETVGVRSGLGWYVAWAQGWAEYSKVYAALVIMAAFFSTIMTLLFKLRDRVLVWQKGMIKW